MLLYILFSIFVLLCEINAVLVKDFFPFNGDNELPKGAYQRSPELQLDPPFLFIGQAYDTLTVLDDGRIMFGNNSATVSAFNAQIDTTRKGTVYYKLSTSEVDLKRALDEIVAAFPMYLDLKLAYVVVATYINVAPFNSTLHGTDSSKYDVYHKGNSFQMVIVGHQNISFAILNYGSINWYKPNTALGSGYFLIGRDGYANLSTGLGFLKSMNITKPEDILNIDAMSNCLQPGKFIRRVDRDTIFGPAGLCAFPPKPANGFCKANEYIPGSVAQCGCVHLDPKLHTEIVCNYKESIVQPVWDVDLPDCPSDKIPTKDAHKFPIVSVLCAIVLVVIVVLVSTLVIYKCITVRRHITSYRQYERESLQPKWQHELQVKRELSTNAD